MFQTRLLHVSFPLFLTRLTLLPHNARPDHTLLHHFVNLELFKMWPSVSIGGPGPSEHVLLCVCEGEREEKDDCDVSYQCEVDWEERVRHPQTRIWSKNSILYLF